MDRSAEALVNVELEQGILGSLLLNNDLVAAVSFLKSEHFGEPLHREIYDAISRRVAGGEVASPVTMGADIPAVNGLGVTPAAYLAKLAASAWTAGSVIVGSARELVKIYAKREAAAVASQIIDTAKLPGSSPVDLISTAEAEMIRLSGELGALDTDGKEEAPEEILQEVERRRRSGSRLRGVSTGINSLDDRLGGLSGGQMVVVGGRPGAGKTAFGLSMGRAIARRGGGVGYISLEMPKSDLWHRMLSDEARSHRTVPYRDISRGAISSEDMDAIREANERIKRLPFVVRDSGNKLSDLPGHIRAIRQRLEAFNRPLNVLIVDYLGLLRSSDRYAGQRVHEVGEISATIKALAMRENIAIVALHQLSRQNEQRDSKRPQLSDLRDSGNVEQDADVVMFVHRESYYIERGMRSFPTKEEQTAALVDCQNELEIIIAKQRQGEVCTCRLWVEMGTNAVRDEDWRTQNG